jgi:MFS transporter, DHA2 family, multidrug resistance protein
MMRQLGGSFGVAVIITFMANRLVLHENNIANHLDRFDPDVQNRIAAMQHSFIAKGVPANIALQDAYKAMQGMVMKQASVLSYMDVFLYIGILFLICIPFILMVKGNRRQKLDMSAAH